MNLYLQTLFTTFILTNPTHHIYTYKHYSPHLYLQTLLTTFILTNTHLISSHLGFVHPLQDVALHQCLPSSSVCCLPNPGGSLLLCYVNINVSIQTLFTIFILTTPHLYLQTLFTTFILTNTIHHIYTYKHYSPHLYLQTLFTTFILTNTIHHIYTYKHYSPHLYLQTLFTTFIFTNTIYHTTSHTKHNET